MVLAQAEGYFTNTGDAYGNGRKEFLYVTFKNGKWQAMKIVGDSNVPRGKVSFRTLGDLDDIRKTTPAEIQVRSETWNEDGFSWEEASVRFDNASDEWIFTWNGKTHSLRRVHQFEALDAAKDSDQE